MQLTPLAPSLWQHCFGTSFSRSSVPSFAAPPAVTLQQYQSAKVRLLSYIRPSSSRLRERLEIRTPPMFVPKPSQSPSCRSAPRASIGPVPSCLLAPIGRHRLVARFRSQPTSSPQIRAGRHARKARPRSDVDPASHMRPRPARANERPGRPRAPPRRPRRRSAPSALLPPGDAAAGGGCPHSGLVAGASRQRRP